ncbi:MAG: tetratricopeptide repeat protein [Holophagales bacterium]|nr:tetratricopeptide repeat protein [Holophagales bacterium]MYH23910.1 tetratricopeptide repeat protein [Holophagales bacterium]
MKGSVRPDLIVRWALATVFIVGTIPAHAQPTFEPVEKPRMDHYEEPVQAQLTAAQGVLDNLLEAPEPEPAELTRAFGDLGQLYLLHDFMTPAAAALRNAEALDSNDPRWPYFLAIHDIFEGRLEDAIAALDRVLLLTPSDLAARIRRADALLDLNRIDEAEAAYRRILGLDPNHSAAHFGLGRVAFERDDLEVAIERFRTALGGQPEGSVVHHHVGLALRRIGHREEAADELSRNEHVRVAFPDPLFTSLQRLNVSREAYFKRGTQAMRRGDLQEALLAFQGADEALPNDSITLFNLGMVLIELGDKARAEERMRSAIEFDQDYREPHFNLALILAERNDLRGAEHHFRRATEIDPEDLEARVRLAEVLSRLDRLNEAIELLGEVLAIDPALQMARLALGAAHQAAGDRDAARTALLKVLEAAPGAPRERAEAHYRLAVLADSGLPGSPRTATNEAATHLQQAIDLDHDFAEAHALLGRELARREQYGEAASHFGRALARDPANARWHGDRAMALILGQRYQAARGALVSGRNALASAGDTPTEALDHLDTLLARLLAASPAPGTRNGVEALTIAQRLMAERPTIQHAETLAMALAEIGDFERAVSMQRQVLAEVSRRGDEPTTGQEQRLRAYLNNEPAREPWFSP